MNEEVTQEPEADEAPNPPATGEVQQRAEREPVSSRQWLAIIAVICLLIAMFLFMHGGNI